MGGKLIFRDNFSQNILYHTGFEREKKISRELGLFSQYLKKFE